MKCKILICCILSTSNFVYASQLSDLVGNSMGDQEDQLRICYLFENNKLKSKAPCIHESTYVSGGVLDAYTINKKRYDISRFAGEETLLNEVEAKEYSRDPRSLNIVNRNENYISCYKTKSKKQKIDLCVK